MIIDDKRPLKIDDIIHDLEISRKIDGVEMVAYIDTDGIHATNHIPCKTDGILAYINANGKLIREHFSSNQEKSTNNKKKKYIDKI